MRAESAPQSHLWLLNDGDAHPVALTVSPQPAAHSVELTLAFSRAPTIQPAGSARAVLLASIDDSLAIALAIIQAVVDLKRGRFRS